jgi:hypothetical protein
MLLLVFAVLVLAACVFVTSMSIWGLTVTWNPIFWTGGMVTLPPAVVLAILQYRAAFCQKAKAASATAVFLFIIGGFMFVGFASTLGEILLEGVPVSPSDWASLLLPILAVASVGCFGGWINLRWSRRLKLAPPSADRPARSLARHLSAVAAGVACVAILAAYLIRTTPPQYAENVSRDEAPFDLPAGARDVSYCRGVRGAIAYEFTIDEDGFAAWVNSRIEQLKSDAHSVSLKPITEPCTIRRYCALSRDLTGPDSVTVTDGLCWPWPGGGSSVRAAFDRTTNRAYCFAH